MEIKNVAVVGSGSMGTGIAHVSALNGFDVILYDLDDDALKRSKKSIINFFDRSIKKGKNTEEEKKETLSRIEFSNNVEEIKAADLVIEAIIEDLNAKMDLFKELEELCDEDTIFASNTSTMSITKIATATKRSDKFLGLHFFNPAQIMKLVEIIRGINTGDQTVELIKDFVKNINKEYIEVKKDTPGFVVNRMMLIQFNEAIKIYNEGIATKEDIDKAMILGLNHPMGPFTLMDYTGLDISYHSLEYLYEEFGDSKWKVPVPLTKMIEANRLGKKTAKGWYDYE